MSNKLNRRDFLKKSSRIACVAGISGCGPLLIGCRTKSDFDLVISGGNIYDGLGKDPFIADIGISGDTIAQIGKISPSRGKSVIDAKNLSISPGFIDAHDHSDAGLLANPKAESHIRQGITTLVSGNCGNSGPFPIADEIYEETKANLASFYGIDLTWKDIKGFFSRLQESGIALNYSTFVGHGSIRGAAMGFNDRPPKTDEMEHMKELVAFCVKNGALGLSTGLTYAPGSYATAEEVTELCQVAVANGGLYSTHMRDEGDFLMEALDETIAIARETGASVQISHFKIAYQRNWHKLNEAFKKLEDAKNAGISIYCDRYPYIAGATDFSSFNFPLWALQGTTKEFLARLKDPTLESRLRDFIREREKKLGSWNNVRISSVATDKNKKFEGKTVLECLQETDKDAFTFIRDLLIEEENKVGQIIFSMDENNLKQILAHPLVGIGCDSSAMAPYGLLSKGKPHPRGYGTFPRVLGKYVRQEKILPMAEMVKKMTSLAAKKFGFQRRGVINTGNFADLVIFDEDNVIDKATFAEPHQYPEGMEYVIVNGQIVIQRGEHTGNLAGRILKSQASP